MIDENMQAFTTNSALTSYCTSQMLKAVVTCCLENTHASWKPKFAERNPGLWSRKSHHPTPTPDRLRPLAVVVT